LGGVLEAAALKSCFKRSDSLRDRKAKKKKDNTVLLSNWAAFNTIPNYFSGTVLMSVLSLDHIRRAPS